MDAFLSGMAILTDPTMLLVILSGTLVGIIVGALPGLSGATTAALVLPITVTMTPVMGIAFLGSLYCAANFGGSITAILLNAPGDPSASATAFDGYQMSKKGLAGKALGISAIASTIGGITSVIVLIIAAPALARFAYKIGPPEYFALALIGLSMLALVGGEGATKNLISGAIGVLIATVGLDLTTGVERFTFGIPDLTDGVGIVPVLTGIFAISEMFFIAGQLRVPIEHFNLKKIELPTRADMRKSAKSIAIGSGLGTVIGILPALGATAAALLTYGEVKRWSNFKEEFGKGAIEGVAGPEAANNSAVGGAMVPTLALGIPGSTTAAIILAGMLVQGIRPGPHLFNEQPTLLYAVFASMLAANVLYLILGFGFAKLFARVTLIPAHYLWPVVFASSVIGAYAPNQSMVELWIMLGAGIIGYMMRRYGFSAAPLVMGLVLGTLVEETLKQSLILFDQNWLMFFTRPIVDVLFGLLIAAAVLPRVVRWRRARTANALAGESNPNLKEGRSNA